MKKRALKHLQEEVHELAVELIKHGRGDGSLKRIRKEAADVRALIDIVGVPKKRHAAKAKKLGAKYE